MNNSPDEIKNICKNIRIKILELIYYGQSGHIGPSLSIVEILTNIYFNHIDFSNINRNRLILSKGHAAPALYAIFEELNLLKKDEIKTLRKFGSRLQGHPDKRKLHLLDAGTGALGQGLSISIGYSLAFNLKNLDNKVFCILGDGETQEGQIWEAAMYIGTHQLNNILTFIDGNKFQNEYSIAETFPVKNLKGKWESFGFEYLEIDGHDNNELYKINQNFVLNKFKKPLLVYCNTIKGKGISFMENNNSYHHVKQLKEKDFNIAMKEIIKND